MQQCGSDSRVVKRTQHVGQAVLSKRSLFAGMKPKHLPSWCALPPQYEHGYANDKMESVLAHADMRVVQRRTDDTDPDQPCSGLESAFAEAASEDKFEIMVARRDMRHLLQMANAADLAAQLSWATNLVDIYAATRMNDQLEAVLALADAQQLRDHADAVVRYQDSWAAVLTQAYDATALGANAEMRSLQSRVDAIELPVDLREAYLNMATEEALEADIAHADMMDVQVRADAADLNSVSRASQLPDTVCYCGYALAVMVDEAESVLAHVDSALAAMVERPGSVLAHVDRRAVQAHADAVEEQTWACSLPDICSADAEGDKAASVLAHTDMRELQHRADAEELMQKQQQLLGTELPKVLDVIAENDKWEAVLSVSDMRALQNCTDVAEELEWATRLPNVVATADMDDKSEAIMARNDMRECQKRSDSLQDDNESPKRQKVVDLRIED